MKRILLLVKGLGKGGAEQLVVGAIRHGDRTRFHYEVAYVLPWKDDLVAELTSLGVTTHCLRGSRNLTWMDRLRKLIRNREIDLVHVHSPYPAAAARIVVPGSVPIVYTEHNLWARYRAATYWSNMLTFQRNRHVFAVSDHVRKSIRYPDALKRLPMPPVETLYHGVDHEPLIRAERANGTRESLGLPGDVLIVGTVAHLKPHKGHRDLLEAASLVRDRHPDVRFVLVGRGPLEGGLRQHARVLGLDGTVTFTGFRDDALSIVTMFDVFVLPSHHEGLPLALLEAMALGKPPVVTDVGGNPEVVRHGKDGLVVAPADPNALADAIVGLLDDEGWRRALGQAARKRAASFDIRKAVPCIEQVYEGILA